MSVTPTFTGEVPGRSLSECEAVIESGLVTFMQVGEALAEIRDARLYRDTHGDFDTYCQERWGFTRFYAHRVIAASETASVLPMGNKPTSERQARALAPLRDDPKAMAEVMEEVAAEGPVTAERISEKVAARTRPAPAPSADDLAAVEEHAAERDETARHLASVPTPPPETDAERAERDRREALERAARRLRAAMETWHELHHFDHHPARDDVLALLSDTERARLAAIEEVIHG